MKVTQEMNLMIDLRDAKLSPKDADKQVNLECLQIAQQGGKVISIRTTELSSAMWLKQIMYEIEIGNVADKIVAVENEIEAKVQESKPKVD